MPKIVIETRIKGNLNVVFDLARSIDLHEISTADTNEKAIAGKTSGLIELDETVTWRAKHFGITQELTAKITAFDRPTYFVDEMIKGAFKSFKHQHYFSEENRATLMKDVFVYEAPLGFLGRLADRIFLERYMTNFLKTRNEIIKDFAESKKWEEVL